MSPRDSIQQTALCQLPAGALITIVGSRDGYAIAVGPAERVRWLHTTAGQFKTFGSLDRARAAECVRHQPIFRRHRRRYPAMSLFRSLMHAIRRARLRAAEQDLAWMEEVGVRNLIAQRARVADMRTALALDANSNDIARRITRRSRVAPLQGRP